MWDACSAVQSRCRSNDTGDKSVASPRPKPHPVHWTAENYGQARTRPSLCWRWGILQYLCCIHLFRVLCGCRVQEYFDFIFSFLFFSVTVFQQVISPSILIYIKKRGKNKIKATSTFLPISSHFNRLGYHRPSAGNSKKWPSNNEPHTADPTSPILECQRGFQDQR